MTKDRPLYAGLDDVILNNELTSDNITSCSAEIHYWASKTTIVYILRGSCGSLHVVRRVWQWQLLQMSQVAHTPIAQLSDIEMLYPCQIY